MMNPVALRLSKDKVQSGYQRVNRLKKYTSEFIALELGAHGAENEYVPGEPISLPAPELSNPREHKVIASWLTHHSDVAQLFINRALSQVGRTETPVEFVTDVTLEPDGNLINIRLSEEHF